MIYYQLETKYLTKSMAIWSFEIILTILQQYIERTFSKILFTKKNIFILSITFFLYFFIVPWYQYNVSSYTTHRWIKSGYTIYSQLKVKVFKVSKSGEKFYIKFPNKSFLIFFYVFRKIWCFFFGAKNSTKLKKN